MLVLSRKIGESFVIGKDVVVTVRETHGGRIRLAIEAPKDVLVLRQELIGSRLSREERGAPVEPAYDKPT
jgi:carbon storage regulator